MLARNLPAGAFSRNLAQAFFRTTSPMPFCTTSSAQPTHNQPHHQPQLGGHAVNLITTSSIGGVFMSSDSQVAASMDMTPSTYAAPPSTPPPSVRKNLHLSPFSTPSLNRSCDRFIPRRDAQDLDVSAWLLRKQSQGRTPPDATDATDKSNREQRYQQEIVSRLLDADGPAGHGSPTRVGAGCVAVAGSAGVLSGAGATPRVLNFGSPHDSPAKVQQVSAAHEAINALHSKMSSNESLKRKTKRAIPTAPERVLDAPGLLNDYYLNLVDWNCKNILAVALDKTVYLWNAATREIQELLTLDHENYISSLSYVHENGHLLAVGTSNHNVEIWDTVKIARTRVMSGHMARVGSLAWRGQILTSGSKDTTIINHDPRASSHIVSTYHSHKQEVCGLAWNGDGLTLASGGNDNLLALWDVRRQNSGETAYNQPTHCCTEHLAAVKALVRLAWFCGCAAYPPRFANGTSTARLRNRPPHRSCCPWVVSGSLLMSLDVLFRLVRSPSTLAGNARCCAGVVAASAQRARHWWRDGRPYD